jgi:predicted choloylglycine hydrolase
MIRGSLMTKTIVSFLTFVLIILSCFLLIFPSSIAFDRAGSYGGWLEERDGIRILHLYGSYYEMGYQHGILLNDEVHVNFRAWMNWAEQKGFTYQKLLDAWLLMQPYIPARYLEEMQGLADATGLSREQIAVLNVGPYFVVNCGSFAVWGAATLDGTLYHARSHDLSISMKDPDTGAYLVENQFLIVREPDDAYPSLSPSLAGDVTCSDGVNAMGIIPGMLSSWTDDETYEGISVGFRVRIALDDAENLSEAIEILTENKTLGYNFIVSDGKIPEAVAVETTAHHSYVGAWNTSSESVPPFWSIQNVVRRTNLFIDPDMSATQRARYHPGRFPLVSFVFKLNTMSGISLSAAAPYMHYIALSKGIEEQWGKLDLNTTMTMLRDVYTGKTDARFFILQIFQWYQTPYQWVICPQTGDFLVSFASHTTNAYDSEVHLFNMYDLFYADPP